MKKLLAVLLAVSMIFSFITVARATDNGLVISEYGYMSQSGEIIEIIGDETAVKGYAKIINAELTEYSFAMTIAHYDKTGRLLAVKAKQATLYT